MVSFPILESEYWRILESEYWRIFESEYWANLGVICVHRRRFGHALQNAKRAQTPFFCQSRANIRKSAFKISPILALGNTLLALRNRIFKLF